ncbi:MAG: tetratricopeptide repeat protein [Verrucomicrobiia bacterium]
MARQCESRGGTSRLTTWGVWGTACVLVIGVYAHLARSVGWEPFTPHAADQYYNLLVQGFRDGQLSLKKEVPPGLAQLADPYQANLDAFNRSDSGGILDMSYYKGRFYLYFGVTPAVLLFWPFVTLTGHYLSHGQAVAICCAIGFLAGGALLFGLWRRYFADVSVGAVAACILALGLATGVPAILPQCDVYEVAISCGYMLAMLALVAIWRAMDGSERNTAWLAAASAMYGLALGARPYLLLGAVILLAPVARARMERRPVWALLLAATGPITIIGLGLMAYNALRFDNPFEFGWRYELAGGPHTERHFSLSYLWFNLRVYFFQSVGWSRHFPFVQDMTAPSLPPGHGNSQRTFGILANVPLVWLALAAPLAWRKRSLETRSRLRWFVAIVAVFFVICAGIFCLYYYSARRFEIEFLPAMVLLATIGVLGLERALAPTSGSGLADEPVWRGAARCGWGLLLGFSVAFNLCAGVESYAVSQHDVGSTLWRMGRSRDAIGYFEHALRIKPDYAQAHCDLGTALQQEGRIEDAIGHFEQALRLRPDRALVHYDLAGALMQAGRVPEAMSHWEQALQIKPDFVEAHYNLGIALEQQGRTAEAIGHFEQALQIKPDFVNARNELARLRAVP